jgi:hypothetical protein
MPQTPTQLCSYTSLLLFLLVDLINTISLGRQVLLIEGSKGPYILNMANQLLPGIVASKLPSFPFGAFGPKNLQCLIHYIHCCRSLYLTANSPH